MPAGMELYGPNGALWFSTEDITTREVGTVVITSNNVGLPNIGPPNYSYYVDYPCPATTAPWMYVVGNQTATAVGEVVRLNGGTARLTFNLAYNTTNYPPGAVVTIYYGWGKA